MWTESDRLCGSTPPLDIWGNWGWKSLTLGTWPKTQSQNPSESGLDSESALFLGAYFLLLTGLQWINLLLGDPVAKLWLHHPWAKKPLWISATHSSFKVHFVSLYGLHLYLPPQFYFFLSRYSFVDSEVGRGRQVILLKLLWLSLTLWTWLTFSWFLSS